MLLLIKLHARVEVQLASFSYSDIVLLITHKNISTVTVTAFHCLHLLAE